LHFNNSFFSFRQKWSSPYINRFLQPDTLIPGVDSPQTWNRFSYAGNNPIIHNDPTGHCADGLTTILCFALGGAIVGGALYAANVVSSGQEWNWGDFGVAAGTGAVAGALIAGSAFAVAAGAISATMATAGAGAGVGMAVGGGSYMVGQTLTGSDFNAGELAISASVGGATGALGPIVGTTFKGAMTLNAASGATQYEMMYYAHHQELDLDSDVLWAAGTSAATTFITGPYQSPTSYYGNMKPKPTDSSAIWNQMNGWSTQYPSSMNNPYATAHLAANLSHASLKQVGPVSAVNTIFNTIGQKFRQKLEPQ